TQRLRHRRLLYGVGGVCESVADVHGADGPRGGPRRQRNETQQPLTAGDTMEQSVIDRREAIRRVSAMLGGAAFVGGTALLDACERPQSRGAATGGTSAFTAQNVAFLDEVADTI